MSPKRISKWWLSGGDGVNGHWTKKTTFISVLFMLSCCSVTESAPLKIDKNTIELLNNGLKALISIRQILSTIQTFNELSAMLKDSSSNIIPSSSSTPSTTIQSLESLSNPAAAVSMATILSSLPSKPRTSFVQKLFGKIPAILLLPNNKALLNTDKVSLVQRDPSMGLIKIGEKPPPGLFPETLPYSVSQFESSGPGSSSSTNNNHETLKLAETTQTISTDFSSKTLPEPINRFLFNGPTETGEFDYLDHHHHHALISNPYRLFASAISAASTR